MILAPNTTSADIAAACVLNLLLLAALHRKIQDRQR